MKNKSIPLSYALAAVVGAYALVSMPAMVLAGDMVIEEGSVFSETFEKDGRRVEVTKTYTRDGVVIDQKIYDAETGALIREKRTVNPIKDHVQLVPKGEAATTQNTAEEQAMPEKPVETAVPVQKAAPTPTPVPALDEPVVDEEEEVEAKVGPEALVERSRQRYGLTKVNRVFVGQAENRSEVAMEAVRSRKLFGLFEVEVPVSMVVDSETGEIVKEEMPLKARLLELLSF